jgi:hypothetical protein
MPSGPTITLGMVSHGTSMWTRVLPQRLADSTLCLALVRVLPASSHPTPRIPVDELQASRRQGFFRQRYLLRCQAHASRVVAIRSVSPTILRMPCTQLTYMLHALLGTCRGRHRAQRRGRLDDHQGRSHRHRNCSDVYCRLGHLRPWGRRQGQEVYHEQGPLPSTSEFSACFGCPSLVREADKVISILALVVGTGTQGSGEEEDDQEG